MGTHCRFGAAAFLLTVCPVTLRAAGNADPTLDGEIASEEWAAAELLTNLDGISILAERHDDLLFVGRDSDRGGILTVYIAVNDTVRVLHASDAIAEAIYSAAGDDHYTLTKNWGEWDRSQDEAGQAKFFETHGWVATIGPMAPRGEREFAMDLSRLPEGARFALSYAAAPEYEMTLTLPDGLEDATTSTDVQRGFLPLDAAFDVDSWWIIDQLMHQGDIE